MTGVRIEVPLGVRVAVAVVEGTGVTDGVGGARQPENAASLHRAGCRTPPTQHVQHVAAGEVTHNPQSYCAATEASSKAHTSLCTISSTAGIKPLQPWEIPAQSAH